jgi:hypothetical protein
MSKFFSTRLADRLPRETVKRLKAMKANCRHADPETTHEKEIDPAVAQEITKQLEEIWTQNNS